MIVVGLVSCVDQAADRDDAGLLASKLLRLRRFDKAKKVGVGH